MTDEPQGAVAGLKRHRLFRIATLYAVAGWLVIQAADIILEAFEAPAWAMRAFLVVVLVGFPVTLIAIWLVERTQEKRPAKTLGSILTIGLALLLSAGAYQYWSMGGDRNGDGPTFDRRGRNSNPVLAVLPFTSMSSLEDNAHLADGMTEDIITLLAQSPGVEVIARNSTFKYKNQNPDIRDVGRDLGADYVIEGSVRPLRERIRVTVQVIEADSGAHIWAEQYDRPLSEFFSIQDDVSQGIAAAVGDAVFRQENVEISRSRTDNLSAWALTSQAEIAFSNQLAGDENGAAKARQAVALDPDYALAHAVLGRALAMNSLFYGDPEVAREAEVEARLAARLDPDDPKVNAFLAITLLWTGQPEDALPYAERVTKLSPSYAEGLIYYGDILIHNGRSEEAIPYFDKGIRLTPNAPQIGFYEMLRGEAFLHHGNFAKAEQSLTTANRIFQSKNHALLHYLAGAQLRRGKPDKARATLEASERLGGVSFRDTEAVLKLISSDDGGEHFELIWDDLERLMEAKHP